MEKIVNQIVGQSDTVKDRKQLRDWLKKQDTTLAKNRDKLVAALGQLDPEHHAMGMLYLFNSASNDMDDITGLADQGVRFLQLASKEQVADEPRLVSRVCLMVRTILCQVGAPLKGVLALRRGIHLMQGRAGELTPAHAGLVYLCLQGGFPSAALPTLEEDVLSLNGKLKKTGLTHTHYLAYFYYGGLVYAALKQFERAVVFFEQCVTLPALAISAVALAAYKKHLLVSLLVRGQVVFRRNTTSSAFRQLKNMTTPYQELATAFSTRDADSVAAVLAAHQEVFEEDGNVGLTQQVLASISNKQIRSFTETYVTLSLDALVTGAKLAGGVGELQARLLDMIDSGSLHAHINEKDGMVSFSEAPNTYDDSDSAAALHQQLTGVISLGGRLRDLHDEIALSQEYIERTTEMGPGGPGGRAGMGEGMMQMLAGGFDM